MDAGSRDTGSGAAKTSAPATMSASASDERDFVITRIIDAPRALVFKAWTDPAHLAQWWGPKSFTNSVCEVDLRPGGAHRIVMRGADGVEYPVKGVYREIVAPERLVMTLDCSEHPDAWHDLVKPNRRKEERNPAGEMLQTVTFEDIAGKTKLTIRTRFDTVAIRDAMVKMGMNEGWSQSLDRLEELTAKFGPSDQATTKRNMNERIGDVTGTADREIVITRLINASPELVFEAWTDPKQVAQWWGPNGFTNTIHRMDVRPGGTWRFIMHGPDGVDYPNRIVFHEVVKPERLVYTHGSDDENDPDRFHVTVTFAGQGGKTRLTMQSLFKSAAARDKVVKEYGAIEGGNQHLDRLEAHLAKMQVRQKSNERKE